MTKNIAVVLAVLILAVSLAFYANVLVRFRLGNDAYEVINSAVSVETYALTPRNSPQSRKVDNFNVVPGGVLKGNTVDTLRNVVLDPAIYAPRPNLRAMAPDYILRFKSRMNTIDVLVDIDGGLIDVAYRGRNVYFTTISHNAVRRLTEPTFPQLLLPESVLKRRHHIHHSS